MRAARRRSSWLALALGAAASAAIAHHSFAMFDQARLIKLTGKVKELQWTNPHAFLYVDATDPGGVVEWHIELNSPNNLRRQGWDPKRIKVGEPITVEINPLRDGTHGGLFVSATLADGSVLGEPGGRGAINVPRPEGP